MGRKVSKTGQIKKYQDLINCAHEKQRDIYDTMAALEKFTKDNNLSGKAYDNAKGYMQKILMPICKALCMALEYEISANRQVIDCCNTYLYDVDFIDEDVIRKEIRRLEMQINSLQDDWWECLPSMREIYSSFIRSAHQSIDILNKQIEKLDAYDNATRGLHENAKSQMDNVIRKVDAINARDIFVNGRYIYSDIDMSWAVVLASIWDIKGYHTEYKLKNNIKQQFGFDYETTEIIWKVYQALREKYPNASQLELDWRFTRLLGGLKYDDYGDDKLGKIKWDDVAGIAIDKFYFGNIALMAEEDYFVKFLCIDKEDFRLLRYKVRIQHDIAGGKYYSFSNNIYGLKQTDIEKLLDRKKDFLQETGAEYEKDEFLAMWNKQCNSFTGKADFAHQQIAIAAIMAQKLNKDGFIANFWNSWSDEETAEKAGWLGDATIGEPPSFGPEDYISDLDAKNISTYMDERNMSYFQAINKYYDDLAVGNSRATIFLKSTPLKDVKEKIYDDLVNAEIRLKLFKEYEKGNIDEIKRLIEMLNAKTIDINKIKEKSPDAYNFIKNLEIKSPVMEDLR